MPQRRKRRAPTVVVAAMPVPGDELARDAAAAVDEQMRGDNGNQPVPQWFKDKYEHNADAFPAFTEAQRNWANARSITLRSRRSLASRLPSLTNNHEGA